MNTHGIVRLAADPELRTTPNDKSVCTLRVAHNHGHKNPDGDWVEEVSFFDVETWGTTAENVAKYLTKGRLIYIEGRLQQQRWTTDEGNNRERVRVIARDIQFLADDRKNPAANDDDQATSQTANEPAGAATEDIPF